MKEIETLCAADWFAAENWQPLPIEYRRIRGPLCRISTAHQRGVIGPANVAAIVADDGAPLAIPLDEIANYEHALIQRRIAFTPSTTTPARDYENPATVRFRLKERIAYDPHVAYLLGALIGNGCVVFKRGRHGGIQLTDDCPAVSAKVAWCARQLFELPELSAKIGQNIQQGQYGKTVQTVITSRALAEFIGAEIGLGSYNKHLPPSFHRWVIASLRSLLSALMDTDGGPWRDSNRGRVQASYYTTSLRLAREILHLARLLRIRANISANDHLSGHPGCARVYQVVFNAADFRAVYPDLSMVKPHKIAILESGDPSCLPYDPIPVSNEALRELGRQLSPLLGKYASIAVKPARNGAVCRAIAQEWLTMIQTKGDGVTEPLIRFAELVTDSSIGWERICRVERFEDELCWPHADFPGFFPTVHGYMLQPLPLRKQP